jgi:hypothetical protein
MANGKIVYPSGDPSPLTYTFVKNFDFGHTQGYLETDDRARAFDGTLHSNAGARKKVYELTFSNVLEAQLDALQLAWNVGADIDLYLDGDNPIPDAVVQLITSPVGESQAAFVGGVYTYSFDVRFEEV